MTSLISCWALRETTMKSKVGVLAVTALAAALPLSNALADTIFGNTEAA